MSTVLSKIPGENLGDTIEVQDEPVLIDQIPDENSESQNQAKIAQKSEKDQNDQDSAKSKHENLTNS